MRDSLARHSLSVLGSRPAAGLAQYCLLHRAKEGGAGEAEVAAMLCCHAQK